MEKKMRSTGNFSGGKVKSKQFIMSAPPRKEICDCNALENASKEKDHPIRYDERMKEYYLACPDSGKMMIYYCPFCGGKTPESRRASFFAHVTREEETRIYNLFAGIRTVADVLTRFGQPDRDLELGSAVRPPERDGKPEKGEAFRTLVYEELSLVADIYFEIGTGNSARGFWMPKSISKL